MRGEVALWSAARVGDSPQRVIAILTGRKAIRSGVLWGYVFGITVASSALGYVAAYPTAGARAEFAATFGSNAGLDAIAGPAIQLETVPGYTVWKSLAFLSVLGAVWGLLIATRLLRGEEDAGRWELLLSGQTTPRRATTQALVGIGAGFFALSMLTSVIDVAVGHLAKVNIAPAPMLFFTLAARIERRYLPCTRSVHEPAGSDAPTGSQLRGSHPRSVLCVEDGGGLRITALVDALGISARMGRRAPTADVASPDRAAPDCCARRDVGGRSDSPRRRS